MNEELGIRLQAYLDGELSSRERTEIEARLAKDPELQALKSELTAIRSALIEADPVVQVPESREFYFSQIQRRIAAEDTRADSPKTPIVSWSLSLWLRRAILPLSGVAAACMMLLVSLREGTVPPLSSHEETESPMEETGAVTFRSEAQRVTIVWLYDKEVASSDTTIDDGNQ
ncbi:MAG: hypothetical protein HYR88_06440 [Verrucomicrobia bacterium]|nr:hypothetical protein [Verrucomicrobiota bacterium]MBI3869740.1 hypothetical protein [Verrucomicrobiota bacterium]